MASKPTYEELEQRVKELEKELAERKPSKKTGSLPPGMAEVSLMAVSDPMNILDPNFRIIWANEARARMHQWSLEQMIGRPCYEVFQRRKAVCEGCPVAETLRTGKPCTRERLADRPDGVRVWTETQVWPVFDDGREITHIIEYARDVTVRKLAEEALLESEEKYRKLVNTTNDLVFTVDVEGNIIFANTLAKRFTGYEPEDITSQNTRIRMMYQAC